MNDTTYAGRNLEDLKSSRRAVNRKMDDITQQAAIITGILPLKSGRKFWCVTEINWDDPNLNGLRETYFKLAETASSLDDAIANLEEDNLHWGIKKANHFLTTAFDSFEEEATWLKKNGLNTFSLAEKILENPQFLNEVEL